MEPEPVEKKNEELEPVEKNEKPEPTEKNEEPEPKKNLPASQP